MLRQCYLAIAEVASSLSEADAWQPTRCAGWSVRDLLFHLLGDAQRGLVALATPAGRPADRDAVSYWADAPGQAGTMQDPEYRNLRATRTMASAVSLGYLVMTFDETVRAVSTAAEAVPLDTVLATQGHALAAADLLSTLTVEAVVHHLDLVVALDAPGPTADSLATVRTVLDGLLGRACPLACDELSWVLAATGRRRLTEAERAGLGEDARRLPLLG